MRIHPSFRNTYKGGAFMELAVVGYFHQETFLDRTFNELNSDIKNETP